MKYDLDHEIREWSWRRKFDGCGGGVWYTLRRFFLRLFRMF